MRAILGVLVVVVISSACSRAPEATTPREDPKPIASIASVATPAPIPIPIADAAPPPATPTSDDPKLCDPKRAPKVLSKIPCVEETESYLEHKTMGFSKDGRYLGYCIAVCDPCPTDCTFTDGTSRAKIHLAFYSTLTDPVLQSGKITEDEARRRGDLVDAQHQKFLTANAFPIVTAQRALHGAWTYDDVILESKTATDAVTGKATVELGGSVEGGPAIYPIKIEVGPHSSFTIPLPKDSVPKDATPEQRKKALQEWKDQWVLEPRLAVVDVTPDGKEIGAVAFAHGAMWFEAGAVARMPVTAFVARIYDDSGKAAKAAGDTARADALFAKAKAAKDTK